MPDDLAEGWSRVPSSNLPSGWSPVPQKAQPGPTYTGSVPVVSPPPRQPDPFGAVRGTARGLAGDVVGAAQAIGAGSYVPQSVSKWVTGPSANFGESAGRFVGGALPFLPFGGGLLGNVLTGVAAGGAQPTEEGTAASHIPGAALGGVTGGVLHGLGGLAGRSAAQQARRAAQEAAELEAQPTQVTREAVQNALSGTGNLMPTGPLTDQSLDTLTETTGRQLGTENARFTWEPNTRDIARDSNDVLQSIGDPQMRARWQQMFRQHVLGGLTGQQMSGEGFANYVQGLRQMAADEWRDASGPYRRDMRKIAQGLRKFANDAENQASGGDVARRDALRESYAQLSSLQRATPVSRGPVASAAQQLAQRQRELGGAANLRRAARNDPYLQRLIQLRDQAEAMKGRQPRRDHISPWLSHHISRPIAHGAALAGAAASRHVVPWWISYPAIYETMIQSGADARLSNMAAAAARQGARGAGVVGSIPPGAAGAAVGQAINTPHITVTPLAPSQRIPEAQ